MRGRAVSLLLLFIGLSTPVAAQGGFREWNYICAPGSFQACASVSVYAEYDPTTETTAFRLRIANLQGAESWLANSGQYAIQGIGISNWNRAPSSLWPDPYGFPHDLRLNWQANGGAPSGYEPFSPNELAGSSWLFLPPDVPPSLSASYTLNGGLWGCDGQLPGPRQGATWMCGGYLEYTFFFAGQWELTGASELSVGFRTTSEGGFVQCSTATDCVTVTPEPFTMILLGTGLASLGGLHARRRRREKGLPAT